MTEFLPKCWHIYIVDLEPRVRSKPGKTRPCLAIQPDQASEAGLTSTVAIPLTSKVLPQDAYPLRVRIRKGLCNLKVDSDLMIDQILAWDNSLFKEELGILPEILQQRVKSAIKDFLELH
ncbi:MAG: type II toxin-antitoxin system PemK/MazF family toxin [Deltaproteobacteria bacterium]|nr:type II toxin-antitoxin system PemK/MazF family toxin [Deltaproteobacteria bacterium]